MWRPSRSTGAPAPQRLDIHGSPAISRQVATLVVVLAVWYDGEVMPSESLITVGAPIFFPFCVRKHYWISFTCCQLLHNILSISNSLRRHCLGHGAAPQPLRPPPCSCERTAGSGACTARRCRGELNAERVRLGGRASVHCLCLLRPESTVWKRWLTESVRLCVSARCLHTRRKFRDGHWPEVQGELTAERGRLGGMASVYCLCIKYDAPGVFYLASILPTEKATPRREFFTVSPAGFYFRKRARASGCCCSSGRGAGVCRLHLHTQRHAVHHLTRMFTALSARFWKQVRASGL